MFEEVAALTTGRQVIVAEGGSGEAEQMRTGNATPNIFRLLGARIVQGALRRRDGTPPPPPPAVAPGAAPAPDAPPPPPPRAILSYEFGQRRLGGNPSTVGSVVALGQQRIEVVGVLEPGAKCCFRPA